MMALRHMTPEQLGNIREEHEIDPGGAFYAAARAEIEARHGREILGDAGQARYAILMPLTEAQEATDRPAFQGVANEAKRELRKDYGMNVDIYYYNPEVTGSLGQASETAMSETDFQKDENARLLAYVPDYMSAGDIESFKTSMAGKKFAGVVREKMKEGERYDEVLHILLGVGLIDYARSPSPGMESMVKGLLSAMVDPGDMDAIKGMDLNELLKGVVLLKLRKIDYGEIRDWKDAQDEVLRAL